MRAIQKRYGNRQVSQRVRSEGNVTYGEVHVNVFKVEKDSEEEAAGQFVALRSLAFSENRGKESRETRTFRAISIERSIIPNMKPLYWKCM